MGTRDDWKAKGQVSRHLLQKCFSTTCSRIKKLSTAYSTACLFCCYRLFLFPEWFGRPTGSRRDGQALNKSAGPEQELPEPVTQEPPTRRDATLKPHNLIKLFLRHSKGWSTVRVYEYRQKVMNSYETRDQRSKSLLVPRNN